MVESPCCAPSAGPSSSSARCSSRRAPRPRAPSYCSREPYTTELFSIVPAVVTIAIGAWVVGTGFMSVYNMAIETVFLCYTMDGSHPGGQESVAKLCDEAEAEEMRAARGWGVVRRSTARRRAQCGRRH